MSLVVDINVVCIATLSLPMFPFPDLKPELYDWYTNQQPLCGSFGNSESVFLGQLGNVDDTHYGAVASLQSAFRAKKTCEVAVTTKLQA